MPRPRQFGLGARARKLLPLIAALAVAGCGRGPLQSPSEQRSTDASEAGGDFTQFVGSLNAEAGEEPGTIEPASPDRQPLQRRAADSPKQRRADVLAELADGSGTRRVVPAGADRSQVQASNPAAADAASASEPPLFEGWTAPKLVLLVTGRQDGYIEPCGCTGLANQKGGLARRAALIKQLKGRGWQVVPVDVGGQVRRFGRQAEIKFQTTIEALKKLGYQAVAFGSSDLRLSIGEILAAVTNPPNPFVATNVNLLDLVPPQQVIEAGGMRIGVAAVLGRRNWQEVNSAELEYRDPVESLKQAAAELRRQNCQLMVLLSHATLDETRELARAVPAFHLAISSGGASEPAHLPEVIPGTPSKLIQVGAKGMYAGAIGVFGDNPRTIRYQRVPLDARFQDSADVLAALAAYQQQLEAMGLEALGLRPVAHPSGNQFVGSQVCGECHTNAYAVWEGTPHHEATRDIVEPTERSDIPRHFDPECLSCHVTGWNPQGYYPYQSGYWSLESSAHLTGSGCENCHGPGSAHVAAERGEQQVSEERQLELREQMRLPISRAERVCLECHDLDNSPDFHRQGAFEEYWRKIEHYGVD